MNRDQLLFKLSSIELGYFRNTWYNFQINTSITSLNVTGLCLLTSARRYRRWGPLNSIVQRVLSKHNFPTTHNKQQLANLVRSRSQTAVEISQPNTQLTSHNAGKGSDWRIRNTLWARECWRERGGLMIWGAWRQNIMRRYRRNAENHDWTVALNGLMQSEINPFYFVRNYNYCALILIVLCL
jgi:hypothetical protein